MTKNEIIEAINSVIVSNDQKGITAESLANILIEMVNATPEGGGGGGGGVMYIEITLGEDELTAEQKAHNAAIYNTLIESLGEVIVGIRVIQDDGTFISYFPIQYGSSDAEYIAITWVIDGSAITGALASTGDVFIG